MGLSSYSFLHLGPRSFRGPLEATQKTEHGSGGNGFAAASDLTSAHQVMHPFILCAILLATVSSAMAEQEWKIRKDVLIYEGVVSGKTIKVVVSEQAFDPSKHKTTELRNQGTEENPNWVGATVDGRTVIGTDQTLPPKGLPQVGRIVVHFGDQKVEVPSALTRNVFLPHLHSPGVFTIATADSIISVSADAKCVLIDLGVGDGGGTSTAFFAVSEDGKASTERPRRPEP